MAGKEIPAGPGRILLVIKMTGVLAL